MADVEVRIKPESFTTAYPSSITKNATGIIYFSSGDFAFPEDVWDDFPVIIVGWWLNALADYKQGFNDSVDLHFMDGDFLVRLSGKSNWETHIEMIQETSKGDKVHFSGTTDLITLYRSIDNAAASLIEFCEKQPREVPDYGELAKAKRRASDAFRYHLE